MLSKQMLGKLMHGKQQSGQWPLYRLIGLLWLCLSVLARLLLTVHQLTEHRRPPRGFRRATRPDNRHPSD